MSELIASEALYGFCVWLTTRKEKTIMSSTDDTAPVSLLVKKFCKENNLAEPRNGWSSNLVFPSSIQ